MSHGKVWHSFFWRYKLWRGAVYGRAVIQNGITVFTDTIVSCKRYYQGKNNEEMFIFCRKKPDLLTFNTGATKICANVKKNAEH